MSFDHPNQLLESFTQLSLGLFPSISTLASVTMDKIPKWNVVHKLEKRKLLIAINCLAGLSIFFFGYDQGKSNIKNTAQPF